MKIKYYLSQIYFCYVIKMSIVQYIFKTNLNMITVYSYIQCKRCDLDGREREKELESDLLIIHESLVSMG